MTAGQTVVEMLTHSADSATLYDVMVEAGSRLQAIYIERARLETSERRRQYWMNEVIGIDELRRGISFGDRESMIQLLKVWSNAYEKLQP